MPNPQLHSEDIWRYKDEDEPDAGELQALLDAKSLYAAEKSRGLNRIVLLGKTGIKDCLEWMDKRIARLS